MSSGMHYTETRRNCSGVYIKKARESTQMTKQKLAAKLRIAGLNISSQALAAIENGKRVVGDYELKVFADVLGIPIFQLLGFEIVFSKITSTPILLDTEESDRNGQSVYRAYDGRKINLYSGLHLTPDAQPIPNLSTLSFGKKSHSCFIDEIDIADYLDDPKSSVKKGENND